MEVTPKSVQLKSVDYSPCGSLSCGSKETPRQELSASLKARLKRSRRSFTSPFSVAKRLCVDVEDGRQVSADPQETVNNPPVIPQCVDVRRKEAGSSSERFPGTIPDHSPSKEVAQKRDTLSKEVKDKMETLRRLKMVKMYRSKNDLAQLQTLIDKWRSCAQAALLELQSDFHIDGRTASLSELMDLFSLDDRILHFDRTEEDFTP
ncbi:swi5-dependent recombination DNA repair protein 1 homolog [Aulostomus maculatus]